MEPTLENIRSLAQAGGYRRIPIKRDLLADFITPIEAMRALRAASNHCFLLESAEAEEYRGRYTFLGMKPSLEFTCRAGKAQIRRNPETDHETCESFTIDHPNALIRSIIKKHKSPQLENFPPFAGGLVGYFSFDYLSYSEPTLRAIQRNEEDTQQAEEDFLDVDLMLFDSVVVFDSYKQIISCITGVPIGNYKNGTLEDSGLKNNALRNASPKNNTLKNDLLDEDQLEQAYNQALQELDHMEAILKSSRRFAFEPLHLTHELTPRFSQAEYSEMIAKAKHYIFEGDIFQVVLSNPLTAPATGSLFDAYRVLRCTNPSPYMLYFTSDNVEIAGASPETLTRLEGSKLYTFPLAGTRPRGNTPEEDAHIEAELLHDEKELAEHNMLVDLGRNDLGRVCKLGSIQVHNYLDVLKFSRVMHIGSTVVGTINPQNDALDAVDAVLPAGTLSGAPKIRACEIIRELEGTPRGIYGGALGYLDLSGNMDICIAIRLAYKKNGTVCVQSGAGIVADSDPASEYQECQNKAGAVIDALKAAEGGLA